MLLRVSRSNRSLIWREVTNLPSAMTENELYWQKDKEAFEVFKAKRMTWKELENQVKEL